MQELSSATRTTLRHLISQRRRHEATVGCIRVAEDQSRPSRVACNKLVLDRPVHATMLSSQHTLGLPRPLADALDVTRHDTALDVVMWKPHDMIKIMKFTASDVTKQLVFNTRTINCGLA